MSRDDDVITASRSSKMNLFIAFGLDLWMKKMVSFVKIGYAFLKIFSISTKQYAFCLMNIFPAVYKVLQAIYI